jgi:hypothetical protein
MTGKASRTKEPSPALKTSGEGCKPWLHLLICICSILIFIFGVGTLATYLPGAAHMAEVIDERNLRATAIFYTDFKESAEGSEYIRHTLEYGPRRKLPE